MVQLLTKDLRISKRYILFGFIAMGFSLFLIADALEGLPLALPAALFGAFLIVTTSKSDEKNNNGRMLASLPIRRRDIVNAKYMGIIMFLVMGYLMMLFWRVLAFMIFPDTHIIWFSLYSIYMTTSIIFLYFAIYLPVYFAFGARILQILEYIVAIILVLIPLIFLRYLQDPKVMLNQLSHGSAL